MTKPAFPLASFALALTIFGCSGTSTPALQHILFVGDSLTHGRYEPVRSFNSNFVVDENYGQTGSRAELEPGPWGGIPGIFAQFAVESKLQQAAWEAVSAASSAPIDQNVDPCAVYH